MFNITKLLQTSINLDNQMFEQRDLLIGPSAYLQHAMINLDQALSNLYQVSDNQYELHFGEKIRFDQTQAYTLTLHWCLVISARLKWTHLVVLDAKQWQKIQAAKPATKMADFDKEFLAIKNLLLQSYYTHRQADFKHAWHLLLKLGLVDYQLDPSVIMETQAKLNDLI